MRDWSFPGVHTCGNHLSAQNREGEAAHGFQGDAWRRWYSDKPRYGLLSQRAQRGETQRYGAVGQYHLCFSSHMQIISRITAAAEVHIYININTSVCVCVCVCIHNHFFIFIIKAAIRACKLKQTTTCLLCSEIIWNTFFFFLLLVFFQPYGFASSLHRWMFITQHFFSSCHYLTMP